MLAVPRLRNPDFSGLQGKSLPLLCVPCDYFLYLCFWALGYGSDSDSVCLPRNEVHLALLGSRCHAREGSTSSFQHFILLAFPLRARVNFMFIGVFCLSTELECHLNIFFYNFTTIHPPCVLSSLFVLFCF